MFTNADPIPELPQSSLKPYNVYAVNKDSPDLVLGHDLGAWLFQVMPQVQKQEKFKKIANFLGISIPFCTNKYSKTMEFACQKQSMGRDNDRFLEKQIKSLFKRWQKRWLVIGQNNVFYYEYPEDPAYAIRDNILFDNDTSFEILHIGRTHVEGMFDLSRRKLKISIDGTINGLICLSYVIKAFLRSPYTKINRFTSFAPIREGNDCLFFADGVGYYKELYSALNAAQHDIMITDWWLSPEFPLIRPIKGDLEKEESRLDFTLLRAAKRGVKVHVLIYKEFSLGLNTDSQHAEERLESLHPNIRVMRHPAAVLSLWSHHEKMCIVDKRRVFMGGLDLCWNRMDGNNHPLFNNDNLTLFPGVDYGNPLRKDIVRGRDYQISMLTPNRDPRMPWHDVAAMLVGKICNDFVVHFSAYWNHAKETNYESETLEVKKNYVGIPFDENGEYCVKAPVQDRDMDDDSTPINREPAAYQLQPPVPTSSRANPFMNLQGGVSPSENSFNPFLNLARPSTSHNEPNVFETMKREFDRQKEFNDNLPKYSGYNIDALEQAYSSGQSRKKINPPYNPRPYGVINPYHIQAPPPLYGLSNPYAQQPHPGVPSQYQPQYGTAAYTPYGAYPAAINNQPPSVHYQQGFHRNPFEIMDSVRHRTDTATTQEEFNIFMRDNVELDSTNWHKWVKENPGAIKLDQSAAPMMQGFIKAFNSTLDNQKVIMKPNRFIEDRDEQSIF